MNRLAAIVFGTAVTLSVAAALVGGVRESAQCGAVALLALAGWAVAWARGAARWWLPAGLALLGLAATINRDRVVAGLAVLRADRRCLLPAGALILAGSATVLSPAGVRRLRWTIEHRPGGDRVVVVAIDSRPDPWSTAAALLVLLGPALLTAGAVGRPSGEGE